jgi:hypothetical protein
MGGDDHFCRVQHSMGTSLHWVCLPKHWNETYWNLNWTDGPLLVECICL